MFEITIDLATIRKIGDMVTDFLIMLIGFFK